MQERLNHIADLYKKTFGKEPQLIDILPQAGSERRYFRIWNDKKESVIGTYGANIPENETFFYFSENFTEKKLPVANIYAVSSDRQYYLQEDFGDVSLISRLEAEGYTEDIYGLFKLSLQQLAKLQVEGDKGLDYNKCLTNSEFGRQAIMADLLYFKYYFLDALHKPYDKQKLIDDFGSVEQFLTYGP